MLKRLMMIYPPVNSYRACQIEAWIRSFHTFPRLTLPLAIFRSSLAVSIYWRVSICIHVPSCILSSHCGAVHQFPEVFGIDEFGDVTCHGATKNPDFSGLLGLRDVGRGQLGKPSGPGIIRHGQKMKQHEEWTMENPGKSIVYFTEPIFFGDFRGHVWLPVLVRRLKITTIKKSNIWPLMGNPCIWWKGPLASCRFNWDHPSGRDVSNLINM